MHHSWFTEKNIATPCPQSIFCRREERRAGAWGGTLMFPSTRCVGDRWGRLGRRELTTCLPPLRFHINHWLLKRVLGDWKQNDRKRTDLRVRPRYKSPFCYQLILSKRLEQSEPLSTQEYEEDKTTNLAGLLGAWNEITYIKKPVQCLVYSKLSENISLSLSTFPFTWKPLVLVMLEKRLIVKPLLVANFGRAEILKEPSKAPRGH